MEMYCFVSGVGSLHCDDSRPQNDSLRGRALLFRRAPASNLPFRPSQTALPLLLHRPTQSEPLRRRKSLRQSTRNVVRKGEKAS